MSKNNNKNSKKIDKMDEMDAIIKNTSNLRFKKYMLDLVLPKCDLVFGKRFSSIYIQMFLHKNNNLDIAPRWKYQKSWIGIDRIAENINSGPKSVYKFIKYMEKVKIATRNNYGGNYLYTFYNHEIDDKIKLQSFIKDLDKILLANAKDAAQRKTLKDAFDKMNSSFMKRALSYYEFKDCNNIREKLYIVEHMKIGSSLIFLKLFGLNILNKVKSEYELPNLSSRSLATIVGCRHTTFTRYLKVFEENGIINICRESRKAPSKIFLQSMPKQKPVEKFTCPLCNKEVDSFKKLKSHINRCKDDSHKFLNNLIKTNDVDTEEQLLQITELHAKEMKRYKKELTRTKEEKELNSSSYRLVRYYYDLIHSKCTCWHKETAIIKSHLKRDMNCGEVIEVLRYMANKGYTDLRFFGTSINYALILAKCRREINTEGTEAFLIKFYHKSLGLKMTDRIVLSAYRKITELKRGGYSYSEIKTIIEYMIEKRCTNFNFIVTMANDALKNSKSKDSMAEKYDLNELVRRTLNNSLEYGYIVLEGQGLNYMEKRILLELKEDLLLGKVELTRVNKDYKNVAIALAKEIYNKKLFNNELSANKYLELTQLDKINC